MANELIPAARVEDADDRIHRDLYDKVNENTNAVSALRATVEVLTNQNERFFQLIEKKDENFMKALRWFGWLVAAIVLALLAALIYGAIGADGLKAVRESLPAAPQQSRQTATSSEPMPWTDDVAAWFRRDFYRRA